MDQEDIGTLASSGNVSLHRGFPNPALDRLTQGSKLALDLNKLLIRHPISTYLFRISGHEAEDQGFFDGDLAIVDRALSPRPQDTVLAWRGASFTLCRYSHLRAEDTFWGVISTTIHQLRATPQ